jgi:hypothetical protein
MSLNGQVVEPEDDHTHRELSDFNSECSVELTLRSKVFFGGTTVADLVNKFQIPHFFVEPKASILYSLQPITDPYFEPDETISHLHNILILILYCHLHLHCPSNVFHLGSPTKLVYTFSSAPHASPPPVCDVRGALEMNGRK